MLTLNPFPTPRPGVTSRIKGFNTPSSLITKLEKDNNIDPMCRGLGQSYAHQRWRAAASRVWRRLYVATFCKHFVWKHRVKGHALWDLKQYGLLQACFLHTWGNDIRMFNEKSLFMFWTWNMLSDVLSTAFSYYIKF